MLSSLWKRQGITQQSILYGVIIVSIFLSVLTKAQDTDIEPPRNDDCGSGTLVPVNGNNLRSSTKLASTDNVEACGTATASVSPGVWFWAVGTGHPMRVKVFTSNKCEDETTSGNLAPGFQISVLTGEISVISGDYCESLTCIAGSNEASITSTNVAGTFTISGESSGVQCGFESSTTLTFDSDLFNMYEILVHGVDGTAATGDFDITIEDLAVGAPSNDNCDNAHVLRFFHSSFGATEEATADTDVTILNDDGICESASALDLPGVWFMVSGTGHSMTVQTCNNTVTNFDTKIYLFSGSCDSLVCVAANDNSKCSHDKSAPFGWQSSITWDSKVNTFYRILVTGGDALTTTAAGEIPTDSIPEHVPPTSGEFEIYLSVQEDENTANDVDVCVAGTLLPVGGESVVTSTDLTEPSIGKGHVIACGDASTNNAPGTWFYVLGTGSTMRVSTCSDQEEASLQSDFDTQISVFEDTCSTTGWRCIGGNDDHDGCAGNGRQSSVTWESELFTFYDIFVHGYLEDTIGSFAIRVEDVIKAETPPSNNGCYAAHLIRRGHPVYGTTSYATNNDDVTACGSATASTGPGVWYTIFGSGHTLRAATCARPGSDVNATFDTQISVFSGSCQAPACVGGNDNSCGMQSSVSWDSQLHTPYYILVHSADGSSGEFSLLVDALDNDTEEDEDAELVGPPINDDCSRALFLPVNGKAIGSTVSGTEDFVPPCGSTSMSSSGGVWYWVLGTGDNIRVSTCDFATFDTQISVFEGNCDTLVCLDGNDDDATCGPQSSVTWSSTLLQPYGILVNGKNADSIGIFDISLEDMAAGPPSNDNCLRAHLLRFGMHSYASTAAATIDTNITKPCGGASESNTPGVWYSILGTGQKMRVSTCDAATDFDTQISVFADGCTTQRCIDGNDDDVVDLSCGVQSSVVFDTDDEVLYLVLVHGKAGSEKSTGEFGIKVDILGEATQDNRDVTLPGNDDCASAVNLPLGQVVPSTTLGATEDIISGILCGDTTFSRSPGVWFIVEGNGGNLQASTCLLTTIDTQIYVFEGSCDSPSCIAGNDDSCDLQSSVWWKSEFGTEYYVLVHGYGESTAGNFGITLIAEDLDTGSGLDGIDEDNDNSRGNDENNDSNNDSDSDQQVLLPSNDECFGAISLSVGTFGSTTHATSASSAVACGNTVENPSGGLWYTIGGSGYPITVSTCSDYTDFDTQISIFKGNCNGDCNALSWVAGNNDDGNCNVGSQSTVTWSSSFEENYYVLVEGANMDDNGSFYVSVHDAGKDPSEASSTERGNSWFSGKEGFNKLVFGFILGGLFVAAFIVCLFVYGPFAWKTNLAILDENGTPVHLENNGALVDIDVSNMGNNNNAEDAESNNNKVGITNNNINNVPPNDAFTIGNAFDNDEEIDLGDKEIT